MKPMFCLIAALASISVKAEQAIYAFTADINELQVYNPSVSESFINVESYSPGGLVVGQTLYGGFTYDTNWEEIAELEPNGYSASYRTYHYMWLFNQLGFSYENGLSIKTDNLAAVAVNSQNRVSLYLGSTDKTPSAIHSINLSFVDLSGTAFTGLDLPRSIKLEDYTAGSLGYFKYDIETGNELGVYTRITSLQVIPVPEMPIWALMLGGLCVARLAIFGRRRTINI
ncbi:MAG: hypothetical protein EOO68_03605 [Moraxellaceae bacterium]|nr:MAG: hypothetical protein EOO68_03605 [Moraxellaceae bacterium]